MVDKGHRQNVILLDCRMIARTRKVGTALGFSQAAVIICKFLTDKIVESTGYARMGLPATEKDGF